MTELTNPLSIFLATKIADSDSGHPITLSQEAAHQIIDELERQDRAINRALTGLGAVIEAERRALRLDGETSHG